MVAAPPEAGFETILLKMCGEVCSLIAKNWFGGQKNAEEVRSHIRKTYSELAQVLSSGAECQQKCFDIVRHVQVVQDHVARTKAERESGRKEDAPLPTPLPASVGALTACCQELSRSVNGFSETVEAEAISIRDLGVSLGSVAAKANLSEVESSLANIQTAALKLIRNIADKYRESGHALRNHE